MTYTFKPEERFSKARGRNMKISTKAAVVLSRAIRKKPLTRGKRLLNNLAEKRQSLSGKYYTKASREMLSLLESCEKNAEFLGLDAGRLMIHVSASQGTIFRRRRRKAAFGSRMKSTNVEIMLIERGKESAKPKKKPADEKESMGEKESKQMKASLDEVKAKSEELKHKVEDK